jgi:hypothetical protein
MGRLLTGAVGDFFESPQWGKFKDTHEETFHKGPNSLASRTKVLEKRIQDVLDNQYGRTKVNFNFGLPDISSFIKSGVIDLDDGQEQVARKKVPECKELWHLHWSKFMQMKYVKYHPSGDMSRHTLLFLTHVQGFAYTHFR